MSYHWTNGALPTTVCAVWDFNVALPASATESTAVQFPPPDAGY